MIIGVPVFQVADDETLLASVSCVCGYVAYAYRSAGWTGPVPPMPTTCPDCGAPLALRRAFQEGGRP